MEKIMQITNVNRRFKAFPTMIKYENHTIDNRAKISENSNDFLGSLVKSLKIKFLHPMRRSMWMISIKMKNLKGLQTCSSTSTHEDFSSRQHSEAVARRCFISDTMMPKYEFPWLIFTFHEENYWKKNYSFTSSVFTTIS